MSLVLAFGLSPLGQVPAYAADNGGSTIAAQSGEITAQANYQFGTVKYVLTGSEATTYTVDGATTPMYTGEDLKLTSIIVGDTDGSAVETVDFSTVEEGTKEGTSVVVTVTDDKGAKVNAKNDLVAGTTYKIKISGKGSYAVAADKEVTFTVSPFDLEAAGVTVEAEPTETLVYDGNDKTVSFDNITVTSKALEGGKATLESGEGYEIDKTTEVVRAVGPHTVKVKGLGNFKGTVGIPVTVAQTTFVDAVTEVSGVEVDEGQLKSGLGTQEYGSVEDPVGDVVAGKDTLVRGEDYTVAYYDGNAKNSKTVDSFATDPGTYKVVITGMGDKFEPTGKGSAAKTKIETSYTVGNTGKYITDAAKTAEAADGTYAFGEGVEAKVAFKDAKGAEVSIPAKDYDVAYESWTADDEKELLGSEYLVKWPEEYDNDANKAELDEKGLPATAGDYKLTITGKGDYVATEADDEKHTITAKFTVKPVEPVVGTADGQFVVTTGDDESEYTGEGLAKDVVTGVQYVKDASAESASDRLRAKRTDGDYKVYYFKSGEYKADYFENYSVQSSDETVADKGLTAEGVVDAGEYDAVIVLGSTDGEFAPDIDNYAGPVVVEGAYTITPYDIGATSAAITGVKVGELSYTGLDLDPVITGFVTTNDSDKALKDAAVAAALEADEDAFAITYGYQESPASRPNGKPLTAGTYHIASVTAKDGGNYTGTVEFAEQTEFTVYPAVVIAEGKTVVQLSEDGATWVTASGKGMDEAPAFSVAAPADLATAGAEIAKDRIRIAILAEDGSVAGVLPSKEYKVEYTNNKVKGIAKITVTDGEGGNTKPAEGEEGTLDAYFLVGGESFADAGVELTPATQTLVYTGKPLDPEVSVKNSDGSTLAEKYYTVSVVDANGDAVEDGKPIAVGDYTVLVTPNIADESLTYGGSLTSKVTVSKREVAQADVVTLKLSDKPDLGSLKAGVNIVVDDELAYDPQAKAEENVAIAGIVWFDGKSNVLPLLNATPLTDDELDEVIASYEANGESPDPANWFRVEGDGAHADAGDYEAVITFGGNFSGEVKQAYSIDPLDISQKVEGEAVYGIFLDGKDASVYSATFNGFGQEPEVTVCYIGNLDYNSADPSTAVKIVDDSFKFSTKVFADNVKAGDGTASVTVAPEGNYTGVLAANFTIAPASLSKTKVAYTDEELAATGEPIEPKGKLTYESDKGTYELVEGTDYVVDKYTGDRTAAGDKGVASYVGLGNFLGSMKEQAFEVKAALADQEITASDVSVEEGATVQIGATAKTELTYKSGDESVATVAANGTVTGVKVGETTIAINAAASDEYKSAEKTIKVTVTAKKSDSGDNQGGDNQGGTGGGNSGGSTGGNSGAVTPGTGTVTPGTGTGTTTLAANTISVTAKKVTAKAKTLKKKKVTKAASKYFKVSGNNGGTVTYKLNSAKKGSKSFKSKFTVNSKNGKLTIKKNTKKGTYKLTITATSAATDTVAVGSAKKVVTVKVK